MVALFLGVAAAVFFLFDVVEVAGFLVVVAVVFLVEEALLAAGFFVVDGLLAVALGLEAVVCALAGAGCAAGAGAAAGAPVLVMLSERMVPLLSTRAFIWK